MPSRCSSKTSINFLLNARELYAELSIFIVWFLNSHYCISVSCSDLACDCHDAFYRTERRLAAVLQKSHVMSYCHQILSWQFVSDHFSFLPQLHSPSLFFFSPDKFLPFRLNSHSLLVTEFLGVKQNTFYSSLCAVLPPLERFIQNVICCEALCNRAVDLTTLLFLRWRIDTFRTTRLGFVSNFVW